LSKHSLFSFRRLPPFGRNESIRKRTARPSQTGRRLAVQILARIAIAASCTGSAAAYDTGRIQIADLAAAHDVRSDTYAYLGR